MALIQHAWAGEPHSSESIKYVDGVEVARTVQIVGPFQVDAGNTTRIVFPVPEGATRVAWRAQYRSTELRDGYDDAGYYMTFNGLRGTSGRALTFPADGQWHDSNSSPAPEEDADEVRISFLYGRLSSPRYEVRHFQVLFDSSYDWPEYWDGDTPDYYDNATPKVYTNNGWATLAPKFYA